MEHDSARHVAYSEAILPFVKPLFSIHINSFSGDQDQASNSFCRMLCKLYRDLFLFFWMQVRRERQENGWIKNKTPEIWKSKSFQMVPASMIENDFLRRRKSKALISPPFPFLQFHLKEYPLLIWSQWAPLLKCCSALHSQPVIIHCVVCPSLGVHFHRKFQCEQSITCTDVAIVGAPVFNAKECNVVNYCGTFFIQRKRLKHEL